MIRSLYAPRPHPYYILAPEYQRTSAGIRVMHMLCDALNRCGYEAYVSSPVVHPDLMTPLVTQQMIELHKSQGLEPIVVYPEVVSGNPLGGDVVVRYLLNTPGFLRKIDEFDESDIVFSYTKGLMLSGMPEINILFLQPIDLRIFVPSEDPIKRIPGKVCYYQGRLGRGVDKSVLPDDAVEITSRYPDTWEELVDIFQTCEFFYSSATTALSAEAALCGCIGIVVPGESAPLNFSGDETGSFGCSWGFAPQDIERARQTLPLLRERLEQQEQEFWPALDRFIATTQRAASERQEAKRELSVHRRLERRRETARSLLQKSPALDGLQTLGVLVVAMDGNSPLLRRTLASIDECTQAGLAVLALVVGGSKLIPAVDDINRVLRPSSCDWFLVLQAGEELTCAGVLATLLQLAGMTHHRAVYADAVTRAEYGRFDTVLRPDINLDFLLSNPSVASRHWLFRRDNWDKLGRFSVEHPQAFELEFILRVIETGGLHGIAHIAEPLLIAARASFEDKPQEREVIERYLHKRGYQQAVVPADPGGRYSVDYGHTEFPLVTIIILLEGQLVQAQRCLDTLLANTSYQRYEILLLDRGNDDTLTIDWLAGIEAMGADQLRVLRFTTEFSASAIRNHGATQARGEYLLFLDAAAGITAKNWLQQLLNHALRPEVGCVGAKVLDGAGIVRHGFSVLGLNGPLGDPFAGVGAGELGYMERLQIDQSCAAVSGECLMLRQELFISAGGFDDSLSPWADSDLCLRLVQAGYLNIWTPRVRVLVAAPPDVAATIAEQDRFYDRWLPVLAHDPAYNPNLSLAAGEAFKLAVDAWPSPAKLYEPSAPRVIAHPVREQVFGQARFLLPFNALQRSGILSGVVAKALPSVVELQRWDPDVILLQRQLGDEALEAMRRMKTYSRAFMVYELDRYLPGTTMPGFNSGNYGPEVLELLRRGASYADRLIVPTPMLAQVFDGFSADLRVLETRLDPVQWSGLQCLREVASKPRIGLVLKGAHGADAALVADVVRALAETVEWVFIGNCPEHLRALMHEVHHDLDKSYSTRLAMLSLDLALVPLQATLANRCKSNERLLELGACGVPVICSDLEAHRSELPVTLVADGTDNWMDAVRAHLADRAAMQRLGDELQSCVRNRWMLEGATLERWADAWLAR